MNIWRVVRREATAAWRSMRYDLRRPPGPVAADHPQYDAYLRRSRRMRTALAAAAVAAGGAAATYLGVSGGLSTLVADGTAPGGLPAASADHNLAGPVDGSLGAARATGTAAQPPEPTASGTRAPAAKPAGRQGPGGTDTVSAGTPPVPTPAPHPPCGCPSPPATTSPPPSASPSETPSPSPPEPSTTPGP